MSESRSQSTKKPRVLLTNDDGPPGPDSPYIFGLARKLTRELCWDVKVVIPSSQKSWIGKAFHIKEIVKGGYYYPQEPDGEGESTFVSRPLREAEGETSEWILLDATPATCANIGLHNLYKGEIDLVISGPNLGRNSSAAFALSSGTIGAALSAALSGVRAIALSYGTVQRPVPLEFYEPAHALSCRIIEQLWENWPVRPSGSTYMGPDLYNVNIPMVDSLIREPGGMRVVWTHMWRSSYGRLFKPHVVDEARGSGTEDVEPGGPDAAQVSPKVDTSGHWEPSPPPSPHPQSDPALHPESRAVDVHKDVSPQPLSFKFAPDFKDLIVPAMETLPVGSDAWAIAQDWASVTPLCASFAESFDVEYTGVTQETSGNGVRLFKL